MPRGGRRGGRGGGRGGKRGGGGNQSGIARSSNHTNTGKRVDWVASSSAVQQNPQFEAFYWDQKIVEPEQWNDFMHHLRLPLPTSFRITSGKATTKVLLDQMRNHYVPFLSNVEFEGEPVPPPKPMPWYPEDMGWQIDVKKNALRKTEQFKKFQQFLVHETEVGNISRQETVSMIPPLFLDVQPHHIVLDMCAAPGSKTAQLIEALHSPLTASAETYDPSPLGIVIANDADAKRAHMLVHQSARLPSPNIVVTNCDASRWPSIRVPWLAKGSETVQERTMKYDRVLADVPCSGDGTLRKNLMIWRDWHPHNASSLHPLQLRILLRGLQSLRNGGRLVYSTCSLNPVEDEAVVAQALRQCNGTVKLVDQSHAFPELHRRKGLFTWKVIPTRNKQKLEKEKPKDNEAVADNPDEEKKETEATPESYRASLPQMPYVDKHADLPAELKEKVPESLWPQGDEEALGLDRCMRILPQDQNTGGFFVAVLEKNDGTEADLEEGMSWGMVRAMAKKNAAADAKAQTVATVAAVADGVTAVDNASKRALSEVEADEAEPSKRAKVDDEQVKTAETENPTETTEVVTATAEASTSAIQDDACEDIGNPGGMPYRENPMVYVDHHDDQSQAIVSFFGLQGNFDSRNLLVRNREAKPLRSVYLTSTSVRALITGGGPGRGEHPYGNPLKLRTINCGVRAFARQDSGKDPSLKCKWRVTSDVIPVLRPLVQPGKILQATIADFAFLTANHYPKMEDVPEGAFCQAVQAADTGSHLVEVVAGTYQDRTLARSLFVPIWRAPASINLMLERNEKSALSYRVFGSDLSNPSGDRQFTISRSQQHDQEAAQKRREAKMAATTTSASNGEMDEDALQALENGQGGATVAVAAPAAVPETAEEVEAQQQQLVEEGQEAETVA